MEPILQIKHLSVEFVRYERRTGRTRVSRELNSSAGKLRNSLGMYKRSLPVIRDLCLNIYPGQIVAVAGASGSGKSLLAHSILDILPYNSHREGVILYDGDILTSERAADLRGKEIVLVPQGVTYLDPLMKVGPQLWKGKKDRETKKRYRSALKRYGMDPETEKRYPFELSGGMARRVMIASASAESPRLIIADEPTPGLDARAAKRILRHFRELADEGAGILFITHDLRLALAIADRVAVFYAGETIEEADAADFSDVAGLRHPFTKALWNAMPEHGFAPASGAQPYPGQIRSGCLFSGQCIKCRKECLSRENIPLQPYKGGMVRCLYPGEEESR